MASKRREILEAMGVGVTIGVLGSPATERETDSATERETDRVFVHPTTGLVGGVLDAVEAVGGTPIFEYDNFAFVATEIPSDRREELLSDVRVAFIEDDDDVGVPSDWTPSIPDLLGSGGSIDCSTHPAQRPSWGWTRIGADAVDPDGTGVDVGILDTGIESDHCSLTVAGGRNFTDNVSPHDYEDRHGHGTHVAGITGALDNDIGTVGVAPNTNLYAVKVIDDNGSGRHSTLIAGIDWCMSNDVELISMSLGSESGSATVDRAIEEAYSRGHLLLCSAGNNDNDGDGSCDEETMTYPATHDDVVAVSAMNEDDTLAAYSSVGATIDLLAPGTRIVSTYINNEYARASGTSAACPFVTGVAALVWQTRDEEGPGPNEPVRAILTETAETVLGTCEEGYGLVDAPAAVDSDRETDDGDRGTDDDDRETDDGDRGTDDGDRGTDDGDEVRDENPTDDDRPISLRERLADIVANLLERVWGLFR